MKTRRRGSSPRLAKQAVELSFAAPQVVAHRVARLAKAGTRPTARDRNELLLMGSEKVNAFYQSWAAMWVHAYWAQVELAQSLFAAAFAPFFGGGYRTPSSLTDLPRILAQVISAGLAPVHKKTVANARRLSRRKGRRKAAPG